MTNTTSEHGAAVRWICDLLQSLSVPYQAVGGLAATAYGSTRPLADLDFYIRADRLDDVARATAPHVVRPPSHHHDGCWDLVFMKIEYPGCEIELAAAECARYFDRSARCWRDADIDFDSSVIKEVLGARVPVMSLQQLLEYKRALGREVDVQDVIEVSTIHSHLP